MQKTLNGYHKISSLSRLDDFNKIAIKSLEYCIYIFGKYIGMPLKKITLCTKIKNIFIIFTIKLFNDKEIRYSAYVNVT